jgi:HicB family
MPRALHAELARSAEREGISLNQFITNSLASMVGWGQPEGGSARAAGGRALSPEAERHSRLVLWALLANAVVIGLAAIVAITLLLLAWLG